MADRVPLHTHVTFNAVADAGHVGDQHDWEYCELVFDHEIDAISFVIAWQGRLRLPIAPYVAIEEAEPEWIEVGDERWKVGTRLQPS